MLERSEREGRYVPLDRMARTHAQAPYTFLTIAGQMDRGMVLYHIQADEGEGSRMHEGRAAVEQVPSDRNLPRENLPTDFRRRTLRS